MLIIVSTAYFRYNNNFAVTNINDHSSISLSYVQLFILFNIFRFFFIEFLVGRFRVQTGHVHTYVEFKVLG